MKSINKYTGIIIGISLLLMAAAAFWSMGSLLGEVQTADSPNRYQLLLAQVDTFNAHLWAWRVIIALDLIVAIAVIVHYHSVNSLRAVMAGGIRLVYTLILIVAFSSLSFSLNGFQSGISVSEFNALNAGLDEFYSIWNLGLIIFGVHLILWARLISKPKLMERILQILLFLGGLGYILTSGGPALSSSYDHYSDLLNAIFILPMVLGELGIGVFLLAKGLKKS